MNGVTAVVSLVLAFLIFVAVRHLLQKGGGCSGCSGCSKSGACPYKKEQQ